MPVARPDTRAMNELGSYVRQLREDKGWTARDLAERIDRDPSYVSRLETGRQKETPGPDEARRLASALGVGVADLLLRLGYDLEEDVQETTEAAAERTLLPIIRAHEWTPAQLRAAAGALRAIAEMDQGRE